MQKLTFYLRRPRYLAIGFILHIGSFLSDKTYLKWLFFLKMGYRLNLKNPTSFNEKLNWQKIYDRNPEYIKMVDKAAVKEYVSEIIGKDYIIPTIGVWDKPENIEWNKLPSKFVIKTTHGGGSNGVIICKDKSTFDIPKAIEKLNKSLAYDMYGLYREWPYKNVPRRLIVEEFIEPDKDSNDLSDYKFFCFDGSVKALFVATDRNKLGEDVKFDFFDANFNHLPFKQGHENASVIPRRPLQFEEMKLLASKLSIGYPQMRVDLYNVNGKVYFGEITLFHFGAITPFEPRDWDYKFGEWVNLPISI